MPLNIPLTAPVQTAAADDRVRWSRPRLPHDDRNVVPRKIENPTRWVRRWRGVTQPSRSIRF